MGAGVEPLRRPRSARPSPECRPLADGFSLVELMVVLLIAGILLGIGIPTYLGARRHAEHAAAQAALTTALTTAQGYYDSHESYAGLSTSQMQALQPNLDYASTSSSAVAGGRAVVGISVGPGTNETTGTATGPQSLSLAALAADGTCWYALDVEAVGSAWFTTATPGISAPGVYYGAAPAPSSGSCAPETPGQAPASGWKPRSTSTSQSGWTDVSA